MGHMRVMGWATNGTDESLKDYIWVADGSYDGLQIGHESRYRWVIDESHMGHTFLYSGLTLDEAQMDHNIWVTNGHTLEYNISHFL